MKKFSICLLSMVLTLALTQTVKAGDDGDGHIGARAGWQSSLLNSSSGNSDRLSSLYAGVYMERQIIPLLRYSYGIEYSGMGGDIDGFGDYKLGYLGVPVYVKAKLGPLYALAGSGVNFKISETSGMDDKAKAIDIPVFLGGGFKILIFSLEARYGWGLLDVQDNTKNEYFQLGLTLSF